MSKSTKKGKRINEKDENYMEIDEKPFITKTFSAINKNKGIIDDEMEIKIELSNNKFLSSSIHQSTTKFQEDDNIQNIIKSKEKLTFKKQGWVSKFRTKEKSSRSSKNMKNLLVDNLDTQSYNLYQGIEAGPSYLPKIKYCDVTGFETNYQDPRSGLRYYNSDIYKLSQIMTEPIKNQYLSIRKALFIIK